MEDAGTSEKPVNISDSEIDSVDISFVYPRQLVITQIDSESEEEEDQMDQKKRHDLRGLLAKSRGGSSKEAHKTQPLPEIPVPPPPTDLGLQAMPNLKKRRPDQGLEEGEIVPRKEGKQQKTNRDPEDKRGSSVDSREEAEIHWPQ